MGNPLIDVVHLLEQIVVAFKDAYSRPDAQIGLYRRYEDLRKSHEVKLVRGFIVVSGGKKRSLPGTARSGSIHKQQDFFSPQTRLTVIDTNLNSSVVP